MEAWRHGGMEAWRFGYSKERIKTMKDKVKLGIRIDSVLHHKLKIEAVARRITLLDLCVEYFEKGLNELFELSSNDSILDLDERSCSLLSKVEVGESFRGVQNSNHIFVDGYHNGPTNLNNRVKNESNDPWMQKKEEKSLIGLMGYMNRSEISESDYHSIWRITGHYVHFNPIAILKVKNYLSKWIVLFEVGKEPRGHDRVEGEEFILELEWKDCDLPPNDLWVNLSRKSKVIWAIDQSKYGYFKFTLQKWSLDTFALS